VRDFDINDMQM